MHIFKYFWSSPLINFLIIAFLSWMFCLYTPCINWKSFTLRCKKPHTIPIIMWWSFKGKQNYHTTAPDLSTKIHTESARPTTSTPGRQTSPSLPWSPSRSDSFKHLYNLPLHSLYEIHKNGRFRIFGSHCYSLLFALVIPSSHTHRSACRTSAAFRPVTYTYLRFFAILNKELSWTTLPI